MAGRTTRTASRRTARSPLASAAANLDRQIGKAESKATKLDKQAAELRESIAPLKAARDALGDQSPGTERK